jgi:nitroreductase
MNNYTYDIELLNNNLSSRNINYNNLTKNQLISKMCIFYHCIEKGLSLPNIKPNFGVDSGILNTIYKMNEVFIKRFGVEHKILKMIYDSVNEYYEYHTKNKIKIKCLYIQVYLNKYKFLKNNNNSYSDNNDDINDNYSNNNDSNNNDSNNNILIKYGGTKQFKKEEVIINNLELNKFFLSRRSVRNYDKKDIDINIIKNAINNAIYGTPTVCNRPINKVYVITDYEKRKQLLSYQKGNTGFGIDAPVLLIITANLENYEETFERRTPYIGGGMFAQSIVYALHAENLATCCLNWDINFNSDIKVREILNLYNETIIMFITVGHYKYNNIVAFSDKMNVNDIMIIT